MKTDRYLQRIRDAFPVLEWKRHRRIQDGVDHVVIMLDGRIIFRFVDDPTEADEVQNLVRELAFLKAIKSSISIRIPDYTFLPDSRDFAGYEAIPGTRLSPWRFRRLSRSNRLRAAKELADFLSTIHAFPVAKARDLGVEDEEVLFPLHLSQEERNLEKRATELDPAIRTLCKRWLNDIEADQYSFTPTFTHDDLWHKHIYHNPQSGRLTGIIDWGDICIGDPSRDFYGLWAYGKRFVDSVLSDYCRDDLTLKERSLNHYKLVVVRSMVCGEERGERYGRQILSNNFDL